jgi:transcription elongation factor Elf1
MSNLVRAFRCPTCGGISPVNAFWDRPEVLATLEDDGVQCLHCDAEFEWEVLVTVFGLSRDKCEKHFYPSVSSVQPSLPFGD